MTIIQLIGMFVVGTKHQFVGMRSHQRNQGIEISGRTAFADEDFHAEMDFLQGSSKGETLVVGGDACPDIFQQTVARHGRSMAVNGFSVFLGGGDFSHNLRIFLDDPRVIHHFRKIVDVVGSQQFLHRLCVKNTTRRFKSRGGNTTRRTEKELERHFLSVFNHVPNALSTKHIGDFMRVADSGHRAVANCQTCKLRWNQHGTFNMHMRIDEARHDVACVAHGLFLNFGNLAVLDDNHARKNP